MLIQFKMFGTWWYDRSAESLGSYIESGLPVKVFVDHKLVLELF